VGVEQGKNCDNTPPGADTCQFNYINVPTSQTRSQREEISSDQAQTKFISKTHRSTTTKTFGNSMQDKKEGIIRIVSQNVGCLGISAKANPKQDNAIEWINKHQVDIVGWQEVGIAFHMLKGHESFHERIRDVRWSKSRKVQANNINDIHEPFQWGGTSIISVNEAASRVTETTKDDTGLGRWSAMLFEGKNDHKVRVISAYNPCKTSDPKKMHTVYNQHRRHLLAQGNNNCPRLQFRLDLIQRIQSWRKDGELIIILMDFNEDLARDGPLQQALKECDMVDPIRLMHANPDYVPPPTSKTGSTPIDSIFVSRPLQHIHKGGWLQIGHGIGDHRTLYIDISTRLLFGENKFKIHRHSMRRLKCDNPNIVKKFNELFLQQLVREKTHVKLAVLRWQLQEGRFTKKECAIALQKIDNSVQHSVLYAEKKCRKLNTGAVPFSIEAKEAAQLIELWNNVIRKKRGWNISSKYIRRLAKRCKIKINVMQLTVEDCENERKLARKGYSNVKKEADLKRDQYIDGLAALHASKGNTSKSNILKRMKRNEALRASFKRIKSATKQFHGATERVQIKEKSSEGAERMKITTDKLEIEEAIRDENIKKFSLAYRECPFLNEPLITMLGQSASNYHADQILRGTFQPPNQLNKYTRRFIRLLKMPNNIRETSPIDDVITPQQSKSYWNKKNEKTTSSYSGKHIGTYRAAVHDANLLNIQTSIVDLVFRLGLTLKRWMSDLDVTLLKKPDRIRPQDMRTIGQLEADFNQGASIHFGTRMMNNAMTHKAIPESLVKYVHLCTLSYSELCTLAYTFNYSSSWNAIIVCLYYVDFVLRVYVHISLHNTICLALIIVE